MCKPDPLLKIISQDASNPDVRSELWRVSVLVGGVVLTGYVIAPEAFVSDALPEDQAETYKEQQREADAAEYLHLHTDEQGQGVAAASKMNVRIPMDRIDAWWTALPEPKR